MEDLKIGKVVMHYREDGSMNVVNFVPVLEIKVDDEFASRMTDIKCANDDETIKKNADVVMTELFSRINEIELTDRMEYQIKSKVSECEKWSNGNVKVCTIDYWFEKKTS